jgi:homoserine kinase
MVEGCAVVRSLPLDPELRFVVLVPDLPLATTAARAALPATVPHGDAAFNLGRMGILIPGLADHRLLIPAATGDRLHQGPRSVLFDRADELLASLVDAGALASCWSGAGPSLLALATASTAGAVAQAARRLLAGAAVPGRVLDLTADLAGLTVGP